MARIKRSNDKYVLKMAWNVVQKIKNSNEEFPIKRLKKTEFYERWMLNILKWELVLSYWMVVMTNSYKIQNTHEWTLSIRINDSIFWMINKKDWKWFLYQHFIAVERQNVRLLNFSIAQNKIKLNKVQNQRKITSVSYFLD